MTCLSTGPHENSDITGQLHALCRWDWHEPRRRVHSTSSRTQAHNISTTACRNCNCKGLPHTCRRALWKHTWGTRHGRLGVAEPRAGSDTRLSSGWGCTPGLALTQAAAKRPSSATHSSVRDTMAAAEGPTCGAEMQMGCVGTHRMSPRVEMIRGRICTPLVRGGGIAQGTRTRGSSSSSRFCKT